MDDALITLLPMLPAAWLPWVRLACELVTLFALLAAGVKRIMGDPSPSDGRMRRAVFAALHWVDLFAVNTETVRSKMRRTGSDRPPAMKSDRMDYEP